jgi:hypothetical protein
LEEEKPSFRISDAGSGIIMNVIRQFVRVPLFFYHRENVKLSENQKNKDLNKNKIKDLCVICEKRGGGESFFNKQNGTRHATCVQQQRRKNKGR